MVLSWCGLRKRRTCDWLSCFSPGPISAKRSLPRNFRDSLDDVVEILIRHAWVQRQGNHSLILTIGHGKILPPAADFFTAIPEQMDGDKKLACDGRKDFPQETWAVPGRGTIQEGQN